MVSAIAFAGAWFCVAGDSAAAAIAPLQWSQVPGTASRLAVAPDGSLWALATTPAGPNKPILHQVDGSWKTVPGMLANSIATDRYGTVYVSNSPKGVFSYDGKKWTALGGAGLSDVSVGLGFIPLHALTTFVFALGPAGKTGARTIYQLDPLDAIKWVDEFYGSGPLVGSATELTESPLDLNTYTIPGAGAVPPTGGVYSIASNGGITFSSYNVGPLHIPGRVSSMALVPGGYIGLAYPSSPRGEHLFYFDYATGKATPEAGTAVSVVAGLNADGTGTLLYALDATGHIWSAPCVNVDPTFTEFPGASYDQGFIASRGDDTLWFTDARGLGRITTAGKVTIYPIDPFAGAIDKIVVAAGGDVWFAATNEIGRLTPRGKLTEFPVNTSDGTPYGLAVGSDGALWFTKQWWPSFTGAIGRITTDGNVTDYQLPMVGSGDFWPDFPGSIAAGRDGALWFTLNATGMIGRITTGGKVSYFTVPRRGSSPWDIVAGPDGALWFTDGPAESVENGGNASIGRITTAGKITEFTIPSHSVPQQITVGSDGALWFTEYMFYGDLVGTGVIGRITTAGKITEYPIFALLATAVPTGIATGTDGALWFTDGANIVRRK